MPALKGLHLNACEIGDEGVASLVANLGKDDFKKLEHLDLTAQTSLTDKACATLASALNEGAMPKLTHLHVLNDDGHFGDAAADALVQAAARRGIALEESYTEEEEDTEAEEDE